MRGTAAQLPVMKRPPADPIPLRFPHLRNLEVDEADLGYIRKKKAADALLKTRFEGIFAKFSGVTEDDELDMVTGEVIARPATKKRTSKAGQLQLTDGPFDDDSDMADELAPSPPPERGLGASRRNKTAMSQALSDGLQHITMHEDQSGIPITTTSNAAHVAPGNHPAASAPLDMPQTPATGNTTTALVLNQAQSLTTPSNPATIAPINQLQPLTGFQLVLPNAPASAPPQAPQHGQPPLDLLQAITQVISQTMSQNINQAIATALAGHMTQRGIPALPTPTSSSAATPASGPSLMPSTDPKWYFPPIPAPRTYNQETSQSSPIPRVAESRKRKPGFTKRKLGRPRKVQRINAHDESSAAPVDTTSLQPEAHASVLQPRASPLSYPLGLSSLTYQPEIPQMHQLQVPTPHTIRSEPVNPIATPADPPPLPQTNMPASEGCTAGSFTAPADRGAMSQSKSPFTEERMVKPAPSGHRRKYNFSREESEHILKQREVYDKTWADILKSRDKWQGIPNTAFPKHAISNHYYACLSQQNIPARGKNRRGKRGAGNAVEKIDIQERERQLLTPAESGSYSQADAEGPITRAEDGPQDRLADAPNAVVNTAGLGLQIDGESDMEVAHSPTASDPRDCSPPAEETILPSIELEAPIYHGDQLQQTPSRQLIDEEAYASQALDTGDLQPDLPTAGNLSPQKGLDVNPDDDLDLIDSRCSEESVAAPKEAAVLQRLKLSSPSTKLKSRRHISTRNMLPAANFCISTRRATPEAASPDILDQAIVSPLVRIKREPRSTTPKPSFNSALFTTPLSAPAPSTKQLTSAVKSIPASDRKEIRKLARQSWAKAKMGPNMRRNKIVKTAVVAKRRSLRQEEIENSEDELSYL